MRAPPKALTMAVALALALTTPPSSEARDVELPQHAVQELGIQPGTADADVAVDVAARAGVSYVASYTQTGLVDSHEITQARLTAYASDGSTRWDTTYGRAARRGAKPLNVTAGGYGVTTLDFRYRVDKSNVDHYLRRYRNDGTLLWERQTGYNAAPDGPRVTLSPVDHVVGGGVVYVVGGAFRGGIIRPTQIGQFVERRSLATGSLLSRKVTWTGDVELRWWSVAAVGDDIVVAGDNGPIAITGDRQVFVRRLDGETLAEEWTRTIDTIGEDVVSQVVAGPSGRVFVSGTTGGRLGGQRQYGFEDAFVVAYHPDGRRDWQRQLSSPVDGIGAGTSLTANPTGPVLVRELTDPENGFTYLRISGLTAASGEPLWKRDLPRGFYQASPATTWDAGRVYVAGWTFEHLYGEGHGDQDVVLARFRIERQ